MLPAPMDLVSFQGWVGAFRGCDFVLFDGLSLGCGCLLFCFFFGGGGCCGTKRLGISTALQQPHSSSLQNSRTRTRT